MAELKVIRCKSRRCRAEIGMSDGGILFDGEKVVDELVCRCGRVVRLHDPKPAAEMWISGGNFSLSFRL